MIKAAIFDLGNVLLQVKPERTLEKFLAAIPEDSRNNVCNRLHAGEVKMIYETGAMTDHDFFKWVRKEFKGRFSFEFFKDVWCDIFEQNDLMIHYLNELRERLPIFLLSNTNNLHIQFCLNRFPWLQWFKERIFSHETGVVKPAHEIYQIALNKTGISAYESIFIDDLIQNVKTASDLGMQAYRFMTSDCLISDKDGTRTSMASVFNLERVL